MAFSTLQPFPHIRESETYRFYLGKYLDEHQRLALPAQIIGANLRVHRNESSSLPLCNLLIIRMSHSESFFLILRNRLLRECFLEYYNLNLFKSSVNRYLASISP